MKKFTLVSLVAAAAFATTAAFTANSVSADTVNNAPSTTGEIGLYATTDGKTPAEDGSNLKKITLDTAPSVNFGVNTLESAAKTYTTTAAKTYTTTTDKDLQVTNPGFASDWSVTANASEFTTTDGTVLTGAILSLNGATASISGDDATTGDKNVSGVATPSDLKFDNTEDKTAFAASNGTGVGVNIAKYSDASLYVPAGNTQGKYDATITWTLTDSAN